MSRCLGAVLLLLATTLPAGAGEFVDAAGRRVVLPDHVSRVMPAERNAEVLALVLAPDKLVGLEWLPGRGLLPHTGRRAVLGWRLRRAPDSMAATARQLRPDLIIDAGAVTPQNAAFADQVQRMTGIPYILVDDSFARTPAILRSIGAVLGAGQRADDLALFAEHAIAGLRGRLLIRPANERPHVYFARGANGMATALPGSPAGEALDEAGALNVASSLGRQGEVAVTPQQLLAWNPDIIITEHRGFYDSLHRNRGWRQLAAVRNKRVYLEPTSPFGWIDDPSGINRLIGMYWLSALLYPDMMQEDLRTTTCDFYDKFYRIKLGNKQLEAMMRPAGAPPPELPGMAAEPLVGLGAAPPSSLPPGAPGAAKSMREPAPNSTLTSPNSTLASPGMMRQSGQTGNCVVPHGPSPLPLQGITGTGPGTSPTSPDAGIPGVPPPGRRGRPVPGLNY
ncbi:MAG TPA: ABC transporter substrate-binding protein [Stellaceae bacterium]|nr:ABC transporter substrate-binding protein [Stellaceae bacterium]